MLCWASKWRVHCSEINFCCAARRNIWSHGRLIPSEGYENEVQTLPGEAATAELGMIFEGKSNYLQLYSWNSCEPLIRSTAGFPFQLFGSPADFIHESRSGASPACCLCGGEVVMHEAAGEQSLLDVVCRQMEKTKYFNKLWWADDIRASIEQQVCGLLVFPVQLLEKVPQGRMSSDRKNLRGRNGRIL